MKVEGAPAMTHPRLLRTIWRAELPRDHADMASTFEASMARRTRQAKLGKQLFCMRGSSALVDLNAAHATHTDSKTCLRTIPLQRLAFQAFEYKKSDQTQRSSGDRPSTVCTQPNTNNEASATCPVHSSQSSFRIPARSWFDCVARSL